MRTDDGATAIPAIPAVRAGPTLAVVLRAQGAHFAPLRFPQYRLAWTGRLVSLLGDHFQVVALAAVALALTGRASGLGAPLAVEAVPRVLLMLVGGVATDRFRPRAILVGTSLVQGVLTAALAGLALRGDLALWHLYLYAGAVGTATAFFLPASMAVVPEMLPPEQVRRGNALWSLAFNLARSVAPPLAGVAVALGGGATAFALDAVSFFVATVAFARTR
jgi:MFS family permease